MTNNEKKELFLLILENWFDDKSKQINSENCIQFYNYFIDCLDFEIRFCIEYEPGFHAFLTVVADLLIDFPLYVDQKISEKSGLKAALLNSAKNTNKEDIDLFIGYLKDFFLMFKKEYLL